MVLVRLPEGPVTVPIERDCLPVPAPAMHEAALITRAEPLKFADMVEEAWDEYAKGLSIRAEKKKRGSPCRVPGSDTRCTSSSSEAWSRSWQTWWQS